MELEQPLRVEAAPYEYRMRIGGTALLVIDMQRDFVEPGGFGERLGNDVSLLGAVVPPLRRVLAACRDAGMRVIHTREGHRPDLADCPPSKLARGRLATRIGDEGPMGRILVRGSYGHDFVSDLTPVDGETVVDKPGKGAFHATDLDLLLRNGGIDSLIVTGVTTEVCVSTTVREANDRGYECLVLSDCTGSYFPDLHEAALRMVQAQGGIFGWVTPSDELLAALGATAATATRRE